MSTELTGPRHAAPALALVALLLLPASSASHFALYHNDPVAHDSQGAVKEPDGLSTSVFGTTVTNCVLQMPARYDWAVPIFEGGCRGDPVPRPSGSLTSVVAPGCYGSSQGGPRRFDDGQCGLWTTGVAGEAAGGLPTYVVPPPLETWVAQPGMTGDQAPGAYTPKKWSALRFLDGRIDTALDLAAGPVLMLDVNRRTDELRRAYGVKTFGPVILPGQAVAWAWLGQWTDLNGNGVVDHTTRDDAITGRPSANEFLWLGSCTSAGGAFRADAVGRTCLELPNARSSPPGTRCAPTSLTPCAGATLHLWSFPGNHHPGPRDLPGNAVAHWALQGFECRVPPSCEDAEARAAGDPLFGNQTHVRPDAVFADRTGDPDDAERGWLAGGGAAMLAWGDDGLLVTSTQAYGANCRPTHGDTTHVLEGPYSESYWVPSWGWFTVYVPPSCDFVDVDRLTTVNEDAEALLTGGPAAGHREGFKATSKSAWEVVRDNVPVATYVRFADQAAASSDVYLLSQGPLRGQANDLAGDPGWSREPNDPRDRYMTWKDTSCWWQGWTYTCMDIDAGPGPRFGACSALAVGDPRNPTTDLDAAEFEAQHRGWCNQGQSGDAYAFYRGDVARGWNDARLVQVAAWSSPAGVDRLGCVWCPAGPLMAVPVEAATAFDLLAEQHRRHIPPGVHQLQGFVGRWLDGPYERDESKFPDAPGTILETYASDGWVGALAETTGQLRYRNFVDLVCATEKDPAQVSSVKAAAECNPYLDGNVEEPQRYGLAAGGEWQGACNDAHLNRELTLRPADGVLDTQVLVLRDAEGGVTLPNPGDPALDLQLAEAWGPGPVLPLRLGARCLPQEDGAWRGTELLMWDTGNLGDDMVVTVRTAVDLGADLNQDGLNDADEVTDVDEYAAIEACVPFDLACL